jgi:hypothetical protein
MQIEIVNIVVSILEIMRLKPADVIPLAFKTDGGYANVTNKFLNKMTILIADDDKVLADRVFRNIRDQIAIALNSSHRYLIHWLSSRNGSLIR